MKRTFLILAAVLAAGLPLGELAMAKDHDGRGQGRGQGHGRPEQTRAPERRDSGPPGRRNDGRAYERRYEAPRPPVRAFRDDGPRPPVRSFRDDRDRRYEDGPPPPEPRAARRGGYLPDAYRGGFVEDPQRYRLRAPPRGYAWVRVGGGFALVSLDDGRIFDMVQ